MFEAWLIDVRWIFGQQYLRCLYTARVVVTSEALWPALGCADVMVSVEHRPNGKTQKVQEAQARPCPSKNPSPDLHNDVAPSCGYSAGPAELFCAVCAEPPLYPLGGARRYDFMRD